MSVTYATARTAIASRAQEFLCFTATSGSTTTIVDTNNLQHVDAYWAEATVLMTGGTASNIDKVRKVQTFTGSTSTLTLYSALTGAVAANDTGELYRRFSPADILVATNRAINIAAPDFREKVRAVATAVQDTLQYAFPTGPDFWERGLVGIEYQVWTQANQSTFPFEKLDPSLYSIFADYDTTANAELKTLQLNFNPTTNKLIRFVYDGPLGNVATGTDRIHLDLPELEHLYTQAVAELWRIEGSRAVDSNRNMAIQETARWEATADKLRRQLTQPQPQRSLRRSAFRVSF